MNITVHKINITMGVILFLIGLYSIYTWTFIHPVAFTAVTFTSLIQLLNRSNETS